MSVIYVPICFDLTYTPVRASKERTIAVRETIPVSVEDVDKADAPIAIRATLTDGRNIEYLSYANELWEPSHDYKVEVENPVAGHFQNNPFVPEKSPLLGADAVPDIETILINPKKPHSNNRDGATAAAQDVADNMILINGKPYIKSIGPLISLHILSGLKAGEMRLVASDNKEDNTIDSMLFRADQRDTAIKIANGLFKRAPSIEFEKPEILKPESLTADLTEISILRTAHRLFFRDVESVGIGNLSTEFLGLYLDYTHDNFDRSKPSEEMVEIISKAATELKKNKECRIAAYTGEWIAKRIESTDYTFDSPSPTV